MEKRERVHPSLIFGPVSLPRSFPTGTDRPEPYGYPIREENVFRPNKNLPLWQRYVGQHDWAVLLNRELGRVYNDARAFLSCQQPDNNQARDILIAGLPQFLLCVWELILN